MDHKFRFISCRNSRWVGCVWCWSVDLLVARFWQNICRSSCGRPFCATTKNVFQRCLQERIKERISSISRRPFKPEGCDELDKTRRVNYFKLSEGWTVYLVVSLTNTLWLKIAQKIDISWYFTSRKNSITRLMTIWPLRVLYQSLNRANINSIRSVALFDLNYI